MSTNFVINVIKSDWRLDESIGANEESCSDLYFVSCLEFNDSQRRWGKSYKTFYVFIYEWRNKLECFRGRNSKPSLA